MRVREEKERWQEKSLRRCCRFRWGIRGGRCAVLGVRYDGDGSALYGVGVEYYDSQPRF